MVCLILHNMFFFPHGFIDWFYVVFTNGFWPIPKFHGMVGGKLLLGVMSWMDWFEGKLYVDVIISGFFDTSNCWWGKTFTANHGFYHCGGEVLFLQFPLWKMTFFNIGINKLHGLFQVPQFSIFFPSKHSQFCGFHSIPGWVKGLGAESVRTFPVPLALPLCSPGRPDPWGGAKFTNEGGSMVKYCWFFRCFFPIDIWLVVTGTMEFHSVGNKVNNWRAHIFQRGRCTTNQI
jgi:hypothetical protein